MIISLVTLHVGTKTLMWDGYYPQQDIGKGRVILNTKYHDNLWQNLVNN